MDNFNISLHIDSNALISNDHELIINKKIWSVLNVENYEVCVTLFISNDQLISNRFGIQLNYLTKPYASMILMTDSMMKSISLKITDSEPEEKYTSFKFIEKLQVIIVNILKAHYVYFIEKLGMAYTSIHLNSNDIFSLCNEKKKVYNNCNINCKKSQTQ